MKRLITTLAGKTILFIVCITSFCLLAASVVGITFYLANGEIDFYSSSENEIAEQVINDAIISPYGYSLLWDAENGSVEDIAEAEYQITDIVGNVISRSKGFKADSAPTYTVWYGVLKDPSGKITDIYDHDNSIHTSDEGSEYYSVTLLLTRRASLYNKVDLYSKLVHIAYQLRYAVYFIALINLLILIACFIALMYASGRRPDTDQFYPGPLHKMPYDLLFVLCGIIGIGLCFIGDGITSGYVDDIITVICIFGLGLVGLNMFLGLCMSAASRIKQHTFIKNTIIYRIINLIGRILRSLWGLLKNLHRFNISLLRGLPLVWKTGLVFCGISLLEMLIIVGTDGDLGAIATAWFIEKLILLPLILYVALTLRRLQKSGTALANGDLSYHTDTKGMIWDFKRFGEDMNRIAEGMGIAVEDRLKSERMKTELITNVSHDIKTPLTSIINYASLISAEPCENHTITEYSEVLVRQSEKLKRLIEDLVEASKASTGNLEVLLAPCDAGTFLMQASGEYEEKMQQADLTLITKQPDKELRIMADGRRMWRVFDNLMNNICKYAQPETRVYLTLEEQNSNAVITFKNTSREPLDITEEELMERFTRGDASRNTEGNGLGLSIAKSMTELQGGSMRLTIDGDLFKAILCFPLI